jgi:hypothetical protein
MVSIKRGSNSQGVSFVDISIVLALAMLWLFIAQISPTPIVIAMMSVSFFLSAVFIISRFTGFLSYLKLTRPTWTISYLGSLPIWYILFSILPENKSAASSLASSVADSTSSIVGKIIPDYVYNWFVNGELFAFTESLILGFLLAFFIGVAFERAGPKRENNAGQFWAIVLISSFAAILHTAIAFLLAEEGSFSVSVVLVHQLVSFFVMALGGIFFGMPGIIAPHLAKNDIVFATPGLMLWTIAFCILLDIVSVIFSSKEERKIVKTNTNFS